MSFGGGDFGSGGGGWNRGPSPLDGGFKIDRVREIRLDPMDPGLVELGAIAPLDHPFTIPPMMPFEGRWRFDEHAFVVDEPPVAPTAFDDLIIGKARPYVPPKASAPQTRPAPPELPEGSSAPARDHGGWTDPGSRWVITDFMVSLPSGLAHPGREVDARQDRVEAALDAAALRGRVVIVILQQSLQRIVFRLTAESGVSMVALAAIAWGFSPWPVMFVHTT